MPHSIQSPERARAAFVRYLRARRDDVLGRPGGYRAAWSGIDRLIADLNEPSTEREKATAAGAAAPASWTEAVARAGLTANRLRRRYEADAPLARALLSGVVVSLLIVAHRAGLGDGAGASACLGAAFTLAAVALPPAYRCWRIRARTLETPWRFLRHPAGWWPYPLPDDYQP